VRQRAVNNKIIVGVRPCTSIAAAALVFLLQAPTASATENALRSTTETNNAPEIGGSPQSGTREEWFYVFRPTAFDPDGDALNFRIANLPPWAEFDTTTGMLSGTPPYGSAGTYGNVIIGVTDGIATAALPGFQITVAPAWAGNATLSWQPPTLRTDGFPLTDLSGYRIRYGIPGGSPVDAWISNPAITSYVIENLPPGTYYFAMTAFDSTGRQSDYSNVVSKSIE
jgi:hypothetical protein